MGGNMKTILVVAVAAAVVVAAQGFLSNAALKDGISIRKCDFPFQWSRSTGGASDAQLCNGRVYCVDDAQSPNSPWYVLQSRTNSEGEAFNKNYQAYEIGFGESLVDDYWLGLWCLQKMTAPSNNELLVRVVDNAGNAGTALYSSFSLGLPSSKYRIRVEGFDAQRSDIGDSMNQSNGMQFTTFDQDNDKNSNRNCAEKYKGGWWYNDCKINAVNNFLNGYFSLGDQRKAKGVQWETWATRATVVSTLIVFRPQDSRLVGLNPNVGTNKNRPQPVVSTQLSSSGWSSSLPEQPALGLDLDFYPDETVDDEFFYPKEPSPSRATAAQGFPNSPQIKGTQTVRPSPSTTTKKPSTVSGLVG